MGIHIVRGENVVLLGDINPSLDPPAGLEKVVVLAFEDFLGCRLYILHMFVVHQILIFNTIMRMLPPRCQKRKSAGCSERTRRLSE